MVYSMRFALSLIRAFDLPYWPFLVQFVFCAFYWFPLHICCSTKLLMSIPTACYTDTLWTSCWSRNTKLQQTTSYEWGISDNLIKIKISSCNHRLSFCAPLDGIFIYWVCVSVCVYSAYIFQRTSFTSILIHHRTLATCI